MLTLSNLVPERTGVNGAVLWVSAGEFANGLGPRVIVVLGNKLTEPPDDAVAVMISDLTILGTLPSLIEEQVMRFVTLNRETLLAYWALRLDTATMIERLIPA